MSRAFTKEIDDPPPQPRPERPIGAAPNLVTPRGADLIECKVRDIENALGAADATDEDLLRELRYWNARRASMQIVAPVHAADHVAFGVLVDIIRRDQTVSIGIVGEDEADPAGGLLAWTSPLARAIEGAEVGEEIVFEAGGHTETIKVLSLRPLVSS